MKKYLIISALVALVAVNLTAGGANFMGTGGDERVVHNENVSYFAGGEATVNAAPTVNTVPASNFLSVGGDLNQPHYVNEIYSGSVTGSNFLSTGSTPPGPAVVVPTGGGNVPGNFLSTGSTPPGPAVVVPDTIDRDRGGSGRSKITVKPVERQVEGMTFIDWIRISGPIVPEVPTQPIVKPPVKKPVGKPVAKNLCDCVNMEGDIVFFVGDKAFSVTSKLSYGKEIIEFGMIDCSVMGQAVTNTVENAYAEIGVRGDKVTIVVKSSIDNKEIWRLVHTK